MIKLIDILKEIKVQPSNTGIKKPFYLFVDGDGRLELDREEFRKYILININKIKSLWNNQGGDWDNDNISQDEIDQAVSHVWASFPNLRFQPYFSKTIKDFSEEDENNLITHFLGSLQDEINLNEIKARPSNTGVKKPFYLFIDGDGNLELDKEKFKKFIDNLEMKVLEKYPLTSNIKSQFPNNMKTDWAKIDYKIIKGNNNMTVRLNYPMYIHLYYDTKDIKDLYKKTADRAGFKYKDSPNQGVITLLFSKF